MTSTPCTRTCWSTASTSSVTSNNVYTFTIEKGGSKMKVRDRPSLFDALKQQLGMKLTVRKGPVQCFVFDHVDRPTENWSGCLLFSDNENQEGRGRRGCWMHAGQSSYTIRQAGTEDSLSVGHRSLPIRLQRISV